MAEVTNYNNSEFCWLDLGSTNLEKSKEFYSKLFGWDNFEMPGEETGGYTMFMLNDKPISGMFPLMKEQIEMNIPSHWMSYIKVDDINSVLESIKANDGQVVIDIQVIFGQGSMAIAQAPDGGLFGLWQPENHIGSAITNEHGSVSWYEYGCRDSEKVIKFYETIFGWKSQTNLMGEMEYTIFSLNDQMVAGLYELPETMAEVPSHWLPYFEVNNIDESLENTQTIDGTVIMPKMLVENVGYFAVIKDNVDAVCGLLQSAKA